MPPSPPVDVLFAEAFRRQMAGRTQEAEALYRQILAADSDHADALHCLGVIAAQGGDLEAGAELIREAIKRNGNAASYHSNLGWALEQQGEFDAAAAQYRRAIDIKPTDFHPHRNLGNMLLEQAKPEAAVAAHEAAIALNAEFAEAHSNLIYALNFVAGATTAEQQAKRRRWNEAIARRHAPPAMPAARRKGRKLRIGYVSAHFRHQAATYAFAPLILHHDRDAFEVACYSDTRHEDDVTAALKAAATTWWATGAMSDAAVAAQIRSDGIDILVDCVGHMQGHRLMVFARKPAPIQVTAWGEPTGTGLAAIDYLLADPVLIPWAERPLFAETVFDLPCFLGYWSPDALPPPGPLPAQTQGHITFGSFNRSTKLTDATLALWAGVLGAVPGARLLLKDKTWDKPPERVRLTARFGAFGVDGNRISFLGSTARAEHFAAYQGVDICLDPLPHGGGMTTLDALSMGAPVVTLMGATPSSRLAAAVLAAVGRSEWIAADADGYVALARSLAADLARLEETRAALRAQVQATVAGNPQAYARAVEDAYRSMIRVRVMGASSPMIRADH